MKIVWFMRRFKNTVRVLYTFEFQLYHDFHNSKISVLFKITWTTIRNLFRLKTEIDDTIIKDIKNLFRLKKETDANNERVIRDIENLFDHEAEDYYKPVKAGHFWSNNYIECGSDGDRNITLSIEEYLNKIRPYLKYIISDLKKSDTGKIQLTIAINFISLKANVEERVMHSESNNIEFMTCDNKDEVIQKLFELLLNRYQIVLETSTRGYHFIFDCVDLLYHKLIE